MASPWGSIKSSAPCSLRSVQDEQLAVSLQEEEDHLYSMKISDAGLAVVTSPSETTEVAAAEPLLAPSEDTSSDKLLAHFLQQQREQVEAPLYTPSADTSNDELLAHCLQREFDRQNDQQLMRDEQHINKNSKVGISLQNYRTVPPAEEEDLLELEEGEETSEQREADHWDHVHCNSEKPSFNRRGLNKSGKTVITKHDGQISGKQNAQKVMEQLDTGINTGDGEGFDMRLSNRVFNSLRRHTQAQDQRAARLHEKKEHSTAEGAVDEKTRELLMKMENSGLLSGVNGCISTGKEALVFHAHGGEGTEAIPNVPKECALKIYRTSLNEFKTRDRYVKGDYRFSEHWKTRNARKAIETWAMKELLNLNRMRRHDIPCPQGLLLKRHVLVMSFLGKDGQPAPKLIEAKLTKSQANSALRQATDALERMYRDCNLVHADFSAYNLLWYKSQVWVIDVSQAVDLGHPEAYRFLLRDCRRCCEFFASRDADGVPSPYELFNHVTGLCLTGEGDEFLAQVPAHKPKNQLPSEEPREEPEFDLCFQRAALAGCDLPSSESDGETVDVDKI